MPSGERPATGPLEPSWRALAALTIAAIAGFIGVGFLIDVPAPSMPAYAFLVCAWWAVAALALGTSVPVVSTWSATAMGMAQAFILVITWAAALALANVLGIREEWLLVGLRLPVCVILVVGFGQILRERELAALAQVGRERELAHVEAETQAILEAHAAIVEEARRASTDVTAAVRAALRMSHDAGGHDERVRVILDGDVRDRARRAGHRIHEIALDPPPDATPSGGRLGPWLDDLAFAPRWHIGVAYLLLLSTMLLAQVHDGPWRLTMPVVIGSVAVGMLCSLVVAAYCRRRLARWRPVARRIALPVSLLLGLAVALPLSTVGTQSLTALDAGLAGLARLPAALAIVALPAAYSAAVRRSRLGMSELDGLIVLATASRDLAYADLERARRSVISTLHTHVQGRAAAAIAAFDLADAGVPGTEAIIEGVLRELADLDVATVAEHSAAGAEASLDALGSDPVVDVIASWSPVMDIAVEDHGAGPPSLRYRIATHLEDALVNAAVHGRARHVWVSVVAEPRHVRLTVRDDGMGLRGPVTAGLGLEEIAARGGAWALANWPSGGAVLTVDVPMPVGAHLPAMGSDT